MAFQRLTNPNTYAPSMKPNGAAMPSALSGLMDRVDQHAPAITPKPFSATASVYGGGPQMEFSSPITRPQPEARQSVWQYPRSTMETANSFVRSLMEPAPEPPLIVPEPIAQTPEQQEPAPVKVATQDEQEKEAQQRAGAQYPWADFQPSVIPIPELERLQYFNMTPVQRRGLV